MRNISNETISLETSLIEALKIMDTRKVKTLFVFSGDCFEGLLTIGDIQRAIIRNVNLSESVRKVLDTGKIYGYVYESKDIIKEKMQKLRAEVMPILDESGLLKDVWFWDEIFKPNEVVKKEQFNLPVIIMAGGQGTRLRPLTNVLPKPLIPIGEQTMMEDIMDRFVNCGCQQFYVSVNYKANFIRQYFENFSKTKYHIEYFQEDKPLGTAGSLHLLRHRINDTFFVSNCDIIIDENYGDILHYHRDNNNEITAVAAIKNMAMPYGTFETKEEGLLSGIAEKPTYTFKINTGMYILEPHLLDEIPQNEFYHITYLIEKLMNEGRRVGVYPINEGSWTDIGNWTEYLKIFMK